MTHPHIAAIPHIIAHLLAENEISGNELAARSGVSQAQISRILNGTRKISLDQALKIAAVFNLKGSDLKDMAEYEAQSTTGNESKPR